MRRILFVLVFFAFSQFSVVHAQEAGLEAWILEESEIAAQRLLANVSPPDAVPGVVVASPSRQNPPYYFHWTRDAALTMDVVLAMLEGEVFPRAATVEPQTMFNYFEFSKANQQVPTLSGLGEPKFLVDGRGYDGPWGRPQNDGPALRAITLTRLANYLVEQGHEAWVIANLLGPNSPAAVIKKDLDYVAAHWREPSFDLWEEVSGRHFYTLMVQHRALMDGADLADWLGHGSLAITYQDAAAEIEQELARFASYGLGHLVTSLDRSEGLGYKTSHLDTAVILAVLHGSHDSTPFPAHNPWVLATAHRLRQAFAKLYPINRGDVPGVAVGRYPEDRYYDGNPWFLTTLAFAELSYQVASHVLFEGRITITDLDVDYWNGIFQGKRLLEAGSVYTSEQEEFKRLTQGLIERGDSYLRRVRAHMASDGSMSEQFDKWTGYMLSAEHLTWSYASFLTAVWTRNWALNLL